MMILKDDKNGILSFHTNQISPIFHDENTIKRKLLDGSYHIQTTGKATRFISMNIFAYMEQIDKINTMQSHGEKFKLVSEDKTYQAYLDKVLNWQLEIRGRNRLYSASATFLIIEEVENEEN